MFAAFIYTDKQIKVQMQVLYKNIEFHIYLYRMRSLFFLEWAHTEHIRCQKQHKCIKETRFSLRPDLASHLFKKITSEDKYFTYSSFL